MGKDPSRTKDKKFYLADFLSAFERLSQMKTKLAREGRIKNYSLHQEVPPGERGETLGQTPPSSLLNGRI